MNCFMSDSAYHMLHQVIRLHYHRTRMLLEKLEIYPGQPPLLFALQAKDGQSQKELADKLNIKPATMTVMVARMEKAALVERRQDPEDQRISRVYLTKQGEKVLAEVKEKMKEIEIECFRNFTEEEKMLLRRLLMQMRDNLQEVCGIKN